MLMSDRFLAIYLSPSQDIGIEAGEGKIWLALAGLKLSLISPVAELKPNLCQSAS